VKIPKNGQFRQKTAGKVENPAHDPAGGVFGHTGHCVSNVQHVGGGQFETGDCRLQFVNREGEPPAAAARTWQELVAGQK